MDDPRETPRRTAIATCRAAALNGPDAFRLAFVFLVFALALWSASAALGADFIMRDGKRMEGEILYASKSAIVIRNVSGAVEQLSRRTVERVAIKTRKHGILIGSLENWAEGLYELRTKDKIFGVRGRRVVSSRPLTAAKPGDGDKPSLANQQSKTEQTAATAQKPAAVQKPAVEQEPATDRREVSEEKAHPKIIVTAVKGKEDAAELVFELSLSESVNVDVLLIYATADGTARADADYKTLRGAVILQPGSAGTKVSVRLLDDDLAEGDETFELLVTSDLDLETIKVERALATILDNETAAASQ